MSSPSSILNKVRTFDPDSVPQRVFAGLGEVLALPSFNYASMRGRSRGAAHLCDWVLAVVACHQGRNAEDSKPVAAADSAGEVKRAGTESNAESLSASSTAGDVPDEQEEADED
mmetsp:Transcript_43418/g.114554  ORF Transcript_43418/g.114554 Transcript_43418/m.114554 type:complete len:114 (-) Transcript_43418:315-656(-)